MKISDPPSPEPIDYPLEYAALIRASNGWTPDTLYAMSFEDFLTWRGAFVRLAEADRRAAESPQE